MATWAKHVGVLSVYKLISVYLCACARAIIVYTVVLIDVLLKYVFE